MSKLKTLTKTCFILILLFITTQSTKGQSSSTQNKTFVKGGQFKDLVLPMPIYDKLEEKNIWGAKGVIPRDTHNGIEDNEWCYWGGNPVKGKDGKYTGFDIDLWAEIAKRIGVEYELKPMDFNGLIPGLTTGNLDVALADLAAAKANLELAVVRAPPRAQILEIQHPGGVGEILKVADGGSWAAGNILTQAAASPPGASELAYVAIA